MTPAFETGSYNSDGAWPTASAAASDSAGATGAAENASGAAPSAFEQILQATCDTSAGTAAEWSIGNAAAFPFGTPFQSGLWGSSGAAANSGGLAAGYATAGYAEGQSSQSAPAASAADNQQRSAAAADQRKSAAKVSTPRRNQHASTPRADRGASAPAAVTLGQPAADGSSAAWGQSAPPKGENAASAGGFDKWHNAALIKSPPDGSGGGISGGLAFAMRISPAEKAAPENGAIAQTDATDGSAAPNPLPAATDAGAGLAEKLLAISQPAAESAGSNETAVYLQVSAQTDQGASEAAGTEQAPPAAPTSAEVLSEEQAAGSEPVHSVRLQLSGDNQRVDVRLLEQGGSLTLSVRSSDSGLTRTLQDRLPELNERLSEKHYQSEVWLPQGGGEAANTESLGQDSGGRQHDTQHSNQDRPGSEGQKQSADSGSQDGQASQQQYGRQTKAPKWYQQLTAFESRSGS